MPAWALWLIVAIAVAAVFVAVLYVIARRLQKLEPYATVLRLRTRQKLRFFRLAVMDPRVPRRVKLIPVVLALYLAMPIDIIPDFIPVLGYVDDVAIVVVALALMVRMTPDEVVLEIAEEAARAG